MGIMQYLRRLNGLNRNAKLYLVSTALSGLGLSLFVLLYNLYILSLGMHEDMIGLVTLVASLVAVGAALPMGWVAHRVGYRWAQIIGLAGSALSLVFPLAIGAPWAFIVTELIWGVVFTLFQIVGSPFMAENSSREERPYLFSLQFVLTTLTLFIGTLFGGYLPRLFGLLLNVGAESPEAYRGALTVGTVLLFASALPFLFMRRSQEERKEGTRPRLVVRNSGQVARLLIPSAIAAAGGGMLVPFVNVLWKVSHHLDDASIGQVLAASSLLMTVLGFLAPLLSKRWGLIQVMVVTRALAVGGILAFGFSPWLLLAFAGYLTRDVLVNLGGPLNQEFVMDKSEPEERAAVSALSTMLVNLTWGIGSWLSGVWQTAGEFSLVFALCASLYLGSTVLLYMLFGRSEKSGARREEDVISVPLPLGSPAE